MLLCVLWWLISSLLVFVCGGALPEAEVSVEVLHRPFLCRRKSKYGDILLVHHQGFYQNGTSFHDSRVDGDMQPMWFTLGIKEAIKGWDRGLQDMCAGEKRKLIIPPALAYGPEGKGKIPPDSTLTFIVELLEIRHGPRSHESFQEMDLNDDWRLSKQEGADHIYCSALSHFGDWLAYCTVSTFHLYRLQLQNNINITKMSHLPKVLHSALNFCFAPDSLRLFACTRQASVIVIGLSQSQCKYIHTLTPKPVSRQPAHLMCVSEDGKWLVTANTHCEIHIFDLHKLKYHSTVPVYSSCPTAMAIHPTTYNLVIVHADQQIFEYSLIQKQYTDWSRKLQKQGLHPLWLKRDTPVIHITFNPKKPSHIIMHDMYILCIIDQSLPLPNLKTLFYNQMTLRSLPETERIKHSHAFKICRKFQPLISVHLLEDQSLVVVERPLEDITSQLPAPVRQKKFAT